MQCPTGSYNTGNVDLLREWIWASASFLSKSKFMVSLQTVTSSVIVICRLVWFTLCVEVNSFECSIQLWNEPKLGSLLFQIQTDIIVKIEYLYHVVYIFKWNANNFKFSIHNDYIVHEISTQQVAMAIWNMRWKHTGVSKSWRCRPKCKSCRP